MYKVVTHVLQRTCQHSQYICVHVYTQTNNNNNNNHLLKMHKVECWDNSGWCCTPHTHTSLLHSSLIEKSMLAVLPHAKVGKAFFISKGFYLSFPLSPHLVIVSTFESPFHRIITSPVPSETTSKGEMQLESQETPQCWEPCPSSYAWWWPNRVRFSLSKTLIEITHSVKLHFTAYERQS